MTKEQYKKAVDMVLSYNLSPENQELLKSHVFYAYYHIFIGQPGFDATQFAKDCEFEIRYMPNKG